MTNVSIQAMLKMGYAVTAEPQPEAKRPRSKTPTNERADERQSNKSSNPCGHRDDRFNLCEKVETYGLLDDDHQEILVSRVSGDAAPGTTLPKKKSYKFRLPRRARKRSRSTVRVFTRARGSLAQLCEKLLGSWRSRP